MALNPQNLIPLNKRSPEEQLEIRRKGQQVRIQKQKERKTLSNLMKQWVNREVSMRDRQTLMDLGLDEEDYNKTLLIVPIIQNIAKGDIKSIQLAMELIGEDKEKDLKIKKLQAEIDKLLLEQEQLKSLNSALGEQIQIVMNVGNNPNGDTAPTQDSEEEKEEE